jgi:hypothetical protein
MYHTARAFVYFAPGDMASAAEEWESGAWSPYLRRLRTLFLVAPAAKGVDKLQSPAHLALQVMAQMSGVNLVLVSTERLQERAVGQSTVGQCAYQPVHQVPGILRSLGDLRNVNLQARDLPKGRPVVLGHLPKISRLDPLALGFPVGSTLLIRVPGRSVQMLSTVSASVVMQ